MIETKKNPFEFRYRSGVIALIYAAGFSCGAFDHQNVAHWIAGQWNGALRPLGSTSIHHDVQAVLAVGSALVIAAAILRSWGTAYLKRDVVFDPNLRSERVVADGPYRYVRNPLYVGSLLLAAGVGVLASPWGWVIIFAGNLAFHYRLITLEEPQLLRDQGERYRAYCQAVPRLWPALRPRLPASGARPEWRQALRGELFIWLFAAAVLAAALTTSPWVFWTLLDSALAVFVIDRVSNRLGRRQAKSA
ncbi:MAG: methyltransferase family protein [Terriglobia bacterium]